MADQEPGRGKVAVITGASSGIGRATAESLARQGWKLVLAARERERLGPVVEACGGESIARPIAGDVGDAQTHDTLLREAVNAFGGCDVWINNAAVMAFGQIDKIPADIQERLIRTNLTGQILGSRVAVAHFLARGNGTLINVASVAGSVAQAFAAAYSASKSGVRGLCEALRAELHDHPQVQVCMVSPAAIDTPIWEHAANYTGVELKPVQPLYEPQAVADAIIGLIARPQREVMVGDAARLAKAGHAIAPETTNASVARQMEASVFTDRPQGYDPGAVHEPRGSTAMDAGWTERGYASGETMDLVLRTIGIGAVGIGLGLLATRLLGPRRWSAEDRGDDERVGDFAGGYRYGAMPEHDERRLGDGRGGYGRHGQPGGPEPVSASEEAFRRAGW